MKKPMFLLSALGLALCALASDRDPFWPIGYTPGEAVAPVATAVPTVSTVKEVSKDVLDKIVREEIEKIKRRGTLVFEGRIKAYVQGRWVGKGDSFTMDIQGQPYRLDVLELTTDNIELVPHRITGTPQP